MNELDRSARNTRAAIFAAVRDVGHGNVGKALGMPPSTFSEWFKENGDRLAALLSAARLKAVPVGDITVDPDDFRFLRRQAVKQLQSESWEVQPPVEPSE